MFRIGLVGVGQHSRWAVIRAIQETSEHCELAAACDVKEENLAFAKERGISTYAQYEAMFEQERLDAAYICTLSDIRPEVTIGALQAGLHVVCEKPLADTASQAKTMVEAADRAGKHLIVTFETRYHPYNQKIREWIDEGHLGQVEAIHFQHFWDAHKATGPLAARRMRLMERAGALDCGIHQLDIARFFAGGSWQDIYALGSWFGEDCPNPPHVSVLARLDNGIQVTLNASYAYSAYMEPKPISHVITLVGTDGVINQMSDNHEASEIKLVSRTLCDSVPFAEVPHYLAIGWMLDDFVAALSEGRPLPSRLATGTDGLEAQRIVEEALRQARSGRQ